jgi:hypothetical protein
LIQVKRDKEFDLVPILQDSQEALLFCLIHDDQYFVKRARIVKRMRGACFALSPIARALPQKKWPVAGMKPAGNFLRLFIVDSLAFSLLLYCL